MGTVKSTNVVAIPPGATIRERLEDRGMTSDEFAAQMVMSPKYINQLMHGKTELTPTVAARLESVLGIPASFWSALEMAYRSDLMRVLDELTETDGISH